MSSAYWKMERTWHGNAPHEEEEYIRLEWPAESPDYVQRVIDEAVEADRGPGWVARAARWFRRNRAPEPPRGCGDSVSAGSTGSRPV